MKKVIILFLFISSLFATYDPYSVNEILPSSTFRAKLSANDTRRVYGNIYSLYQDFTRYGIKNIEVKDFISHKFLDAHKAFFVYKSNLKPTYGKYSLIAFENEQNAALHVKEFHGQILSFDEVMNIAQNTLKETQKFMQKRYKKQAFPMGKKLFKKLCTQKLDLIEYF